jgi:hypothetical protein
VEARKGSTLKAQDGWRKHWVHTSVTLSPQSAEECLHSPWKGATSSLMKWVQVVKAEIPLRMKWGSFNMAHWRPKLFSVSETTGHSKGKNRVFVYLGLWGMFLPKSGDQCNCDPKVNLKARHFHIPYLFHFPLPSHPSPPSLCCRTASRKRETHPTWTAPTTSLPLIFLRNLPNLSSS